MSRQVVHWPDPLTFADGRPVRTAEEWLGPRRAELRSLFERQMYGAMPAPGPIDVRIVSSSRLGDSGTLEQWDLCAESNERTIRMLVAIPESDRPVSAIVALNFHGNHTVTRDPSVDVPDHWVMESPASEGNHASEKGRGAEADDWSIENTLKGGFALVTGCYCDVAPDDANQTQPGAIATWAWGVSRILDALILDTRIDARGIGVTGHSRLGKTALLAAAFDERFAFCAPVQSGCGGAAPSRGTVGESVARITTAFPHWFAPSFAEYADRTNELPFDQHELMAMVAPRPLLIANATDDLWANPAGQVEALDEAIKVYRFLGAGENTSTFIRPGGHRMGREDWDAVRHFAREAVVKLL